MKDSNNQVKIGFIEDYSGEFSIYGAQKRHAAMLAVNEINQGFCLRGGTVGAPGTGVFGSTALNAPRVSCHGGNFYYDTEKEVLDEDKLVYSQEDKILVQSGEKGLLGKEVRLIDYDGQSNLHHWEQLARKLIETDGVDALVAGYTSSSREIIRPIVDKANQLYFYVNQYEGGVADKNTFCMGAVCEQQVVPLLDYMIRTYGHRIHILAADYNFGQLTAAWTRAFAPLTGGEIVGEEFVPLGTSKFGPMIARLQETRPDWLLTLLVGPSQQNFYPQASDAGLNMPMASTVNMAQGYEHVRFKTRVMANMHNAVNYMMEIPTVRNKAFVKRWYRMFPNDPYIGQMAQNTYFSIHLYANAARLAGSTDQDQVRAVLESGIHLEAPEGSIFVDPATHHATHYIRLARCDEEHKITFVQEWPAINPWWLQRLGVNLVRNPEYKQYLPEEDPFFNKFTKD